MAARQQSDEGGFKQDSLGLPGPTDKLEHARLGRPCSRGLQLGALRVRQSLSVVASTETLA